MTAKQYLLDNLDEIFGYDASQFDEVEKHFKEFAKYHVKLALKSASEKFDTECNKYAVLGSYPLENII